MLYRGFLEYALRHHGVGNFHESGNIGAADVVHISVRLFAVAQALGVYVSHDFAQTSVDLLGAPRQLLRVLSHFEP